MKNLTSLFTLTFLSLSSLSLLTSCADERGFKEGKTFVSGQEVSAKTLSLGKQVYLEYCMACHGKEGAGDGPAAAGSFPPPRNFMQGIYKFGLVEDYGLPTDEDFHRIIKDGLHGTGMFPWDMSDKQIHAVTQYIKTFAPQVWEEGDQEVGTPVTVTPDPFQDGLAAKARERGKEVYHIVGSCQTCHRAYVSQDEYKALYQKVNGPQDDIAFDPSYMFSIKPQYTSYEYKDGRTVKSIPPDFTWHEVRSARSVEEIYKRMIVGVNGSGMPGWRGTLSEEDLWAVSYYVKELMDLRGTQERDELIKKIEK